MHGSAAILENPERHDFVSYKGYGLYTALDFSTQGAWVHFPVQVNKGDILEKVTLTYRTKGAGQHIKQASINNGNRMIHYNPRFNKNLYSRNWNTVTIYPTRSYLSEGLAVSFHLTGAFRDSGTVEPSVIISSLCVSLSD